MSDLERNLHVSSIPIGLLPFSRLMVEIAGFIGIINVAEGVTVLHFADGTNCTVMVQNTQCVGGEGNVCLG